MSLSVHLGSDARDALCGAFDAARTTIDAEYYSIDDPAVVASLNAAAARGVRVRILVEGDPHRFSKRGAREPDARTLRAGLRSDIDFAISRAPAPLVHAKAAVVDDAVAIVGTANPTKTGVKAPGDVCVFDDDPSDARAVLDRIEMAREGAAPPADLRLALRSLFDAPGDLRIASEDFADPQLAALLVRRARSGRHDRVLLDRHPSRFEKRIVRRLESAGVAVRMPADGYMHEKFIDAGSKIYVGSANLSYNGISEGYEIGIVAPANAFGDGAAALRADFEKQWDASRPM